MMRWLTGLLLAAVALLALGYANAVADPVFRRVSIVLPDWPVGQRAIKVVLMSDVHVAGPDMPPSRLARIVSQVNALQPDIVMIAGDFVSDKRVATARYSISAAIAPLAGLRAPLGTIAVLGNHDHWRSYAALHRAFPKAGITLLTNTAIRRGPLIIAGADDDFTGRADVAAIARRVSAMSGPVLVLSHSPDIAPALPRRATLLLAGHTHCGQIALPVLGPIATMSRYGDRYACGLIREGKRRVIVSAGLGTSIMPLRFGAPPDLWVITLGAGR